MTISESGAYLTYDNDFSQDGLGAQCQRILGIHALSRSLKLGYVHSLIKQIEPNPGEPDYSTEQREDLVARVNQLVLLGKPASFDEFNEVRNYFRLGSRQIQALLKLDKDFKRLDRTVLVRIGNPYPYVNLNPTMYAETSRIVSLRVPESVVEDNNRIDVHIRRAVTPMRKLNGRKMRRHVPTDWYTSVLKCIYETMSDAGKQLRIRVHSDIPGKQWKPTGVTEATRRYWDQHVEFDSEGYLRVSDYEDYVGVFGSLGQVEIARDWDPIDALYSMVSARFLVTSASSFSYFAGLLRLNRPVISPVYWNSPMPSWCSISQKCSRKDLIKLRSYLVNVSEKK